MSIGLHRLLDFFYRPLFGEDIFISYSRLDGSEYAKALLVKLADDGKGFTCFIDELGTEPGKEIPASLRRKVRNCSMLILVGSPLAAKSEAVGEEIMEFLTVRRNRERIIPIDVCGVVPAAVWNEKIAGVDLETDTDPNALTKGSISPNVIARIKRAATYRKQTDRLRNARNGMLALLFLLLCVSGGAGFYAYQQLQVAAQAQIKAQQATAQAQAADTAAKDARAQANRAREEAERNIAEANRKIEQAEVKRTEAEQKTEEAQAEQKVAEAQAQKADTKRSEAERKSRQQEAIAEARKLANESTTILNQQPSRIDDSVLSALESMHIIEAQHAQLLEPAQALRASLSLLPQYLETRLIPSEAGDSEEDNYTFSPDAKHIALLDGQQVQIFQVDELEKTLSVDQPVEGTQSPVKPKHQITFNEEKGEILEHVAISDDFRRAAVVRKNYEDASAERFDIEVKDLNNNTVFDSRKVESYNSLFVIRGIALSHDGNFLAMVGRDPDKPKQTDPAQAQDNESPTSRVVLYDLETKKFRHIYSKKYIELEKVSFNESGKNLVAVGGSSFASQWPGVASGLSYVLLWSLLNGDIREVIERKKDTTLLLHDESLEYIPFEGTLLNAAISNDGNLLAVAELFNDVSVWQLRGSLKTVVARVPFLLGGDELRFSSDNKALATLSASFYTLLSATGYTSVLATSEWNNDLSKLFPNAPSNRKVDLLPSGALSIKEAAGPVYQIDPQLKFTHSHIFFVALTPDGKVLAALGKNPADDKYEIHLYYLKDGVYINGPKIPLEQRATEYHPVYEYQGYFINVVEAHKQLAISPKGNYIAVICHAQSKGKTGLCVWDVAQEQWTKDVIEFESPFFLFAFSSDEHYLTAFTRVPANFNAERENVQVNLKTHAITKLPVKGEIEKVVFDVQGKFLALVTHNKIQVLNQKDYSPVKLLEDNRKITEVVFSPDGRYLLTGGYIEDSLDKKPQFQVLNLDNRDLIKKGCERLKANPLFVSDTSFCRAVMNAKVSQRGNQRSKR